MLDTARSFIVTNPLLATALASLYGAILIDVLGFLKYQSWNDFKAFDWKLAGLRYMQGFIGGFVGTLALPTTVGAGAAAIITLWWVA